MKDLLKLLDKDLKYIDHVIYDNEMYITAKSKRKEAKCPYCGKLSKNVHSYVERSLKDLPIQCKKVIIKLLSKKYFCKNTDCSKTTFSERFDFYEPKATKTNRLQDEIIRVSLTQSSISASRYLRKSVADVGKSTICNLLKKGNAQCGYLYENNESMHR